MSKNRIDETSIFGVVPVIVVLLITAGIAAVKGRPLIGTVLFAAALLGILGRLWTLLAVRRLRIKVGASASAIFPGDDIMLEYTVINDKLLPIPYAEITKELKKPYVLRPVSMPGEAYEEDTYEYSERCSLIGGRRTVKFRSGWHGERRGIMTLGDMTFTSGDGFGICRSEIGHEITSRHEIAVYPGIIPVDVTAFTRNIWEGERSRKGVLEDISVIKLTRPYAENDPQKRINQRMLARGQGMLTNQYEVISPKRVHFIFDGQSFNGENPRTAELEETLSILASVAVSLSDRDMNAGFSFPRSVRLKPVNITSDENRTAEVLYRMADFELLEPSYNGLGSMENFEKVFQPSEFAEGELIQELSNCGRTFFVTLDEDTAKASKLLKRLSLLGKDITVLTYADLTSMKRGK